MIEESPESFMQRWRKHAAEVRLFPRTEGSPLLECQAGSAILQVLERTGPYQAPPGRRRVILNPMVERLEPVESGPAELEVAGLGRLRGRGRVVAGEGRVAVLDCGVPLVVMVMDPAAEAPQEGTFVTFEVLPPVHGFVLPDEPGRRRFENTDDAM